MLTQQDLPPLETTGSTGRLLTVSELPSSTEEVLLRATQFWLIPELVDGDRVVFEMLGYTASVRWRLYWPIGYPDRLCTYGPSAKRKKPIGQNEKTQKADRPNEMKLIKPID